MTDHAPHIVRADTPQGPCAQLRGRWGAAELGNAKQWQAVSDQLRGAPPAPTLGWDLRELQWLDHVGAQLLWNHWQHAWPAQLACTDSQRTMLTRVAQFTCVAPPPEPWRLGEQIDHLGVLVLHGVDHARHLLEMVGQLVLDLVRLARAPRKGPWRDVSGHLYRMGATALPITALVGFLIGVVLAYLMSLQLRQFGAESFIVNILGISLIRELGPMLAAILVAGRTGSSYTAQLGTMRITEEIDALRALGLSPFEILVFPKVIALVITLPLLSLFADVMGLIGGGVVASAGYGVPWSEYLARIPQVVGLKTLLLGLVKAPVFAVVIALVGCMQGLRVSGSAASVGRATTVAVVQAIFLVIVLDAAFSILYNLLRL